MIFSKQFLIDKNMERDYVHSEMVNRSRWSIIYEAVFAHEGKFYKTSYRMGATELQYESPYEYDSDEIECREVVRCEVIKYEWREV
jgi:hypothetical protein